MRRRVLLASWERSVYNTVRPFSKLQQPLKKVYEKFLLTFFLQAFFQKAKVR